MNERRGFVSHAWTFGSLTFVSRCAGLVRDAVCSRVFGASPVWSAFATAFVIPNVFRRLFGEGALSAAFVPRYTQLTKHDAEMSDRFASLVLAGVLALLGGVVIVTVVALGFVLANTPAVAEERRLLLTLLMVMLPFAPLVCATAVAGAMLQTHGRFVPSAAAPILLNACIIVAALLFGTGEGVHLARASIAVAISVTIAGVLQLAWCVWRLRGVVRWRRGFGEAGTHARKMLITMGPAAIGLGAVSLGTLIDAAIAGYPVAVGPTIAGAEYPLDQSAAGVLYYAQRLYQFPLGVFSIAIATAVFPALSRDADEPDAFAETFRRGLRLSVFIALPAAVGLVLVREPIVQVLFGGGRFDEENAARVSWALAGYAGATAAAGVTHVVNRAFYARGDTMTPMKIGIATVALNGVLSATLVWWLREFGIALATAIAGCVQGALLLIVLDRRFGAKRLIDAAVIRAAARVAGASIVMGAAVVLVGVVTPEGDALQLGARVLGGAVAFAMVAWLLRADEMGWLVAAIRRRG